jgi:hypothetical protein
LVNFSSIIVLPFGVKPIKGVIFLFLLLPSKEIKKEKSPLDEIS